MSSFDEFDRTIAVTIIPLLLLACLALTALVIEHTAVLSLLPADDKSELDDDGFVGKEQDTVVHRQPMAEVSPPPPPPPLSHQQRLNVRRQAWRGRIITAALTLAFIVYPGTSSQIVRAFRCQVCRVVVVHDSDRWRTALRAGLSLFPWSFVTTSVPAGRTQAHTHAHIHTRTHTRHL